MINKLEHQNEIINYIEAIIFSSDKPVGLYDLKSCIEEALGREVPLQNIEDNVNKLIKKYESEKYSFGIYKIAEGYQFLTKPLYYNMLTIFFKHSYKKRLSQSAIETLSIIAYKQPISKSQIEQIRGVNCDYVIQKLLDKQLIEIKGKSDAPGKPLLYGTNQKFLEYFGINSLDELPQIKDFANNDNEIKPLT